LGQSAPAWYDAGARIIGGCCRTGPQDIRALSNFRADLAKAATSLRDSASTDSA
jgi:S-methylmethionine-dependent homocysteine/selenocysteine methylase